MRKRFLLPLAALAAASLLSQVTMSQNSAPYWSLAGNNNATSSSKLGTTNGINLRLYTNNVERVRILSSNGYVGIGTTAPSNRLHVIGPSGADAFRVQIGGNTKLLVHRHGGTAIGGNVAPPTNGLYVNGNVGIGTATPSAKLHVVGRGWFTNGLSVLESGIYTVHTTGNGVEAYGNTSYGIGAYGSGYYGVYGSGVGYGVYGSATTYGLYGSASTYGVYGTASTYGVYGNATSTSGYGVWGKSSYVAVYGSGGTYGVYGTGTSYGTYGNTTAGYGAVGTSSSSIGVYGSSSSSWGSYGHSNTYRGVQGWSNSNIGGYFYSGSSHGLWARTASTASGIYAGVFEGSVYTYGTYVTSDQKLKKNVKDVGNAMELISKLKPKYYEFRNDGPYASLALPKGQHYGFLAQEVEAVLPSVVDESAHEVGTPSMQPRKIKGPDGNEVELLVPEKNTTAETINIKAVNYTALIPIIIKGMQEQAALIEQQQAQIDDLKAQVRRLTGNNVTTVTGMGALSANSPNPVRGSTRISYSVPDGAASAHLLVTDNLGKTVQTVTLARSGVLNLNTSGLSSGLYHYSLVVNGKIVASRKMEVIR